MKVGRRNLEISNAEREIFPQVGYRKKDVAEYYKKISKVLLYHIRHRALTLERYPNGIADKGFIQQEAPEYFDAEVGRVPLNHKNGKTLRHVTCSNSACLVALANLGVIAFHCWLSKVDKPTLPDRMIFDLDPGEAGFNQVREGAEILRDFLGTLGLKPFIMTTGSKGAHVVIPLQRSADFDTVREFAADVATVVAHDHQDRLTTEQRKDKRGKKLYIDVMRNGYGQTGIAPYSLRSVEEAAVATPLDWREFFHLGDDARRYTLKNIFHRLARKEDPWRGMGRHAMSLADPRKKLNSFL